MIKMKHTWKFPLPRPHTGILLGNGRMGAIVWGEKGVLKITFGRADFWDHRGAMGWDKNMSYANTKKFLQNGDQAGLKKLLTPPPPEKGRPRRPTTLPAGRIDIDFGEETSLLEGVLDMSSGTIEIDCINKGNLSSFYISMDMEKNLLYMTLPDCAAQPVITGVPAWHYVKEHLEEVGFTAPWLFTSKYNGGWVQECPADPALCVAWRKTGREIYIATALGEEKHHAKQKAEEIISLHDGKGFDTLNAGVKTWWKKYWEEIPEISVPNRKLEFLYTYGMYKFAGLTNPSGVAGTLQGPWIEEYQMPPWSNDYHFNINVQLCYWPAYHSGKTSHLLPLFEMIWSWRDILAHNARMFIGIEDGFMLPHSTDDKGGCIGGYWPGSIDHGSTCWIALMMYRYYKYTMDRKFLLRRAYPFMYGAMRVFEEMLEYENGKIVLPVSVSPEYTDKEGNQAGKNSSFQLACIHALCRALISSAEVLGETPRPVWKDIIDRLPKASLLSIGTGDEKVIGIWDGVPLQESHRHHSHIAGITPFDIFDSDDPADEEIIRCTLNNWLEKGMGLWSGWCIPWASMIHSRVGNAQTAELLLEIFDRVFTNSGHGTLHDCDFPGFILMGTDSIGKTRRQPEIMQLDGGLGTAAAIQEMLIHVKNGITYIFKGAPREWEEVSFKDILTEGAFLVSAIREKGEITSVRVKSLAGGTFKVANPWDVKTEISLRRGTALPEKAGGRQLRINMSKGEEIILQK